MSTTSSVPPSSSSVLPTASSTPSSSSGSSSSSSANYFFGFLITFIVLLLIFVGCGVGSRRGFRFTGTGAGTVWDEAVGRARVAEKQTQPTLWETWLKNISGKHNWSWDTIMPISATFIRPEPTLQEDLYPPPDDGESSTIDHHPLSIQGLRSRAHPFCSLFQKKHHQEKQTFPCEPPSSMQVAVMISMPSVVRRSPTLGDSGSSRGSGAPPLSEFGEFQIGTALIPWDGGELDMS